MISRLNKLMVCGSFYAGSSMTKVKQELFHYILFLCRIIQSQSCLKCHADILQNVKAVIQNGLLGKMNE